MPHKICIPIPVKVNGITYPSQTEAARALGASTTAISAAYKRHGPVFTYVRKIGNQKTRAITIDGRVFTSVAEAARALGVNYHKLRRISL